MLEIISKKFGISEKELKVKMVDETKIIRFDNQIFAKDDPSRLNSLKDCKVGHNAALLVERKQADEIDSENSTDAAPLYSPDVINVDDTEDLRTVIVNTDSDKETFFRYQCNLEWTLAELTRFIRSEMKLPGQEYRLRNHLGNTCYCLEEMDSKLRCYESFKEGGTRLQIELGRPTRITELALVIFIY